MLSTNASNASFLVWSFRLWRIYFAVLFSFYSLQNVGKACHIMFWSWTSRIPSAKACFLGYLTWFTLVSSFSKVLHSTVCGHLLPPCIIQMSILQPNPTSILYIFFQIWISFELFSRRVHFRSITRVSKNAQDRFYIFFCMRFKIDEFFSCLNIRQDCVYVLYCSSENFLGSSHPSMVCIWCPIPSAHDSFVKVQWNNRSNRRGIHRGGNITRLNVSIVGGCGCLYAAHVHTLASPWPMFIKWKSSPRFIPASFMIVLPYQMGF